MSTQYEKDQPNYAHKNSERRLGVWTLNKPAALCSCKSLVWYVMGANVDLAKKSRSSKNSRHTSLIPHGRLSQVHSTLTIILQQS